MQIVSTSMLFSPRQCRMSPTYSGKRSYRVSNTFIGFRQLAVCFGLVYNQIYRLGSNTSPFIRKCRASYGILYDELYDREKHGHVFTSPDPLDGKHRVRDMIHWMIFRDDCLEGSNAPIFKPFIIHRNLRSDDELVNFEVPIVKFTGEIDRDYSRPTQLRQSGSVEIVGRIPCRFLPTVSDMKILRRRRATGGSRIGRTYKEMTYEIKLAVGEASLMFELWFNDRKISSTTADGVNVEVDQSFYDRPEWELFDNRNNTMSSYATYGGGTAR